jgi:hypothetical protein
MRCELCHNDTDLQNSHIIPEFFYKRMYDENHRFVLLSTDPQKREEYLQKGLREELLCRTCEQRLSAWEHYASRIFYGGEMVQTKITKDALYYKDVDYSKFRLFLLSLLWRMDVSKHKFFEKVDLGPHKEPIRQMLLAGDPGEEDQFPCAIVGVLFNGKPGDWFLPADKVKSDGQHCYRIIIAGFLFLFFVSNQKHPNHLMELFIKKDTSFTIPAHELKNIKFLRDICVELGKAIQDRPAHLKKFKHLPAN